MPVVAATSFNSPSYPSSNPAFNHDRTVCATEMVLASSRVRLGDTMAPADEKVRSHSADIAGIDKTSIAILATRGYSNRCADQYGSGLSCFVHTS